MNAGDPNEVRGRPELRTPDASGPEAHMPDAVVMHEAAALDAPAVVTVDPWAHRRGEPRVFALLWTCYVLIAVAGSVLWLATTGRFTATGYGPAARIMLLVVATGCVLVWPMTRLSQRRPGGSVLAHLALDVCVVLFPVQMVLWPLVFIAGWPTQVVLAVAVQFFVWTVLAGGMVAACLAGEGSKQETPGAFTSRTLWMIALVALVLAAPVLMAILHAAGAPEPEWLAMLSPFTGMSATTGTGVSGPQAPLSLMQRQAVVAIGGGSALIWGFAGFRAFLVRAEDGA